MEKEGVGNRIASKERLLQISDLNAELIEEMTDDQLLRYCETLRTSIESFPTQKEKCEDAFKNDNYTSALQWLRAIRNNLSKIHADGLAKDCDKYISLNYGIDNMRSERLKSFLEYFMASSTILFEDIQKVFAELDVKALKEENGTSDKKSPFEEIRRKFMTIPELESERIENLTDEEASDYIKAVTTFLDDFSSQENSMRGALKIRNYGALLQSLSSAGDTLSNIYADNLANDCKSHVTMYKDTKNIRHEKLEIFVKYIITSMSLLAGDIRNLNISKAEIKESGQTAEAEIPPVELLAFGASKSSKHILIVNKSKLFMENLKVSLDGTGYRLLGAATSATVLEHLKTASPDLMILDDDLDMDVWELVKKIRETGQVMPIIFLTTNVTKEYVINAMTVGVADFIVKPIASKNVREKVAKFLVKK